MGRKSVGSYSNLPPVRIAIVNHLLKNKKYVDIPETFQLAEESYNWMNFMNEGYYPVAFVGIIHFCSSSLIDIDENGQICKMKSGTISLEITLYLNPNVTNILHAPLLDSIGWFKTVKFHLVGKLKFHFFSETMPEIQPLERYSYVISDDYDIEKLEKLASKNNTSVARVETIKNEKFEDELLTTVLEEEEVGSLNQSMKRKRGRPSKTSSSDDNIPGEGVVFHEENVLCLPVKLDEEDDHGDDDNERGAKSSNHRNIILHRPWIPSLYILTTLNTIYTLSPALYGALLDDRERWAFLGEILHKQISDDEIEIKALPIQYSVSYFLHLKELKPKRLNQFTGARHRFKVDTLLKGFNSIFINLLYENEKHYLQPYLQYLQTKRTKDQDSVLYSSSFSAIYLVRYLIYLLTVKTSLNIHDLEEQSGQLQKKKRRVTTSMIMDENHPSKEEILSQEIYEMAMKLLDYLASDLYIGYVMSN